MAEISLEEQENIKREVAEMDAQGLITPGYEGMTDEQILKVLLVRTNFNDEQAHFMLDMGRGRLPEKDGDNIIVY